MIFKTVEKEFHKNDKRCDALLSIHDVNVLKTTRSSLILKKNRTEKVVLVEFLIF